MKSTLSKRIIISLLVFVILGVTACSTRRFQTIPPPPPSAKLRVMVLAVTEDPTMPRTRWNLSHNEFQRGMSKTISSFLRDSGIYDVVPFQDVRTALGGQSPGSDAYWWIRDDYALVKEFGRAVHADYAVFCSRSWPVSPTFKMTILNVQTGKKYENSGAYPPAAWKEFQATVRAMYRSVFNQARGDLLASAVRKGRSITESPAVVAAHPAGQVPVRKQAEPDAPKAVVATVLPSLPVSPGPAQVPLLSSKGTKGPPGVPTATDKGRLVVYDFSATERLDVISLILTEALREELFSLGKHHLVNRDNLVQVMQELQIQHSGAVDEKQMVKLGKWFAAREAVTGRLAALGNTYVLQVKRTDLETMNTLGFGSVRCSAGQEDTLLIGIPALAKKLLGLTAD